ncbi:M48 family metalloprotease [Sphingobium boeckii]|uniref:Putative Zn-dependent protease n=1 Tax=Sphingobium boeckii TaxID=1082345 RepID=A0A7W9AFQ6_9SPHN|nr:M48 family metalloprotease [Sphingobium boeckii]MBB5684748.1 putative Zn-dependent protease [Sphingobium boeckii]
MAIQFRSFAPAIRFAIALLLSLAVLVRPAFAQSILRDAETEALFADMSAPLIVAAGLDPRNVKVVLINDPSINAFVAGGQAVYIHSGLISAADNINEVQGVVAHEIGHITGGHIVRFGEGMKVASGISILSLVLGAAALAAGAGDAGMGILAAGQQAAMGKFLAFSRTQESSADAAGVSFLAKAGISGKGSLAFFKRLQNMEYRLGIPQTDSYARTHPLSGERIAVLEHQYQSSPSWNAPIDQTLEARFERVKAKLNGFVSEPATTLRQYPERDKTVPARYARAYAWHKSAYPDKALAEVSSLLTTNPDDPYFLELEGQILLESGRVAEALPPLREAVERTRNQPLIAALFGHALIATEDPKNFDEARTVLKAAVARDNDNPFAWYQLGVVYEREGDVPRAQLATAERYNLEGVAPLALANARQAMQGIPEGTSDWLRAQDIALVSEAEVQKKKKR